MNIALAQQYHKKLAELVAQLQEAQSQEQHAILLRMRNLLHPLYPVHSHAALTFEEAMAHVQHPQQPVRNAALHTMQNALQMVHESIMQHPESQFVMQGQERVFARPVVEEELNTMITQGRLFTPQQERYALAFAIEPGVDTVLERADASILLPTFARMGFPNTEAILFFKTRSIPRVEHAAQQIPSLRIAKVRTGVPITVVKHRAF